MERDQDREPGQDSRGQRAGRNLDPRRDRVGYYPDEYGGYSEHEWTPESKDETPTTGIRSYRTYPSERRYYGLGPSGYRRADSRVLEYVNDLLTFNNDIDASNIRVDVQQGTVKLAGTVEDRFQKKLAEQLAESVWGVEDVQNELRIRRGH